MLDAVLLPVLVVSTVIQPHSVLGRVLEWRPLRWIGTISFSLYLWQELFLPGPTAELARGGFRYLQQPPWNLLAILVCACLSRYLIEIPMTRLGHRISASSLALPRAVDPLPHIRNAATTHHETTGSRARGLASLPPMFWLTAALLSKRSVWTTAPVCWADSSCRAS